MNTTKPNRESPPTIPLLVNGKTFAEQLAVSSSTFSRMDSGGKLPPCVRLSAGCVRWRVDDVTKWVALGCPDRATYIALTKSQTVEVKHA